MEFIQMDNFACHPEWSEAESKFAQAKALQRNGERSKPRSGSDEGIHEGVLLTFVEKVTFIAHERLQNSLQDPNACGVALPMVGFDCEKHPPDIFLRSG
ncbi:MAG: hypothetical protein IJX28_06935 [Clostridia bacterium]|nr:hypothetical protein [Clostridia bacterium]